jgi:hypothetical protein
MRGGQFCRPCKSVKSERGENSAKGNSVALSRLRRVFASLRQTGRMLSESERFQDSGGCHPRLNTSGPSGLFNSKFGIDLDSRDGEIADGESIIEIRSGQEEILLWMSI